MVCHGIPDKRPLVNGDIVNVDVSVFLSGYHADLNETYVVGEVDEASKHLIKATYEVRTQCVLLLLLCGGGGSGLCTIPLCCCMQSYAKHLYIP